MKLFRTWLLLISVITNFAMAEDWTRFRGPNGSGQSDTDSVPAKWTDRDYNWSIDLPGIGHSSPAVIGNKIFLQSADPENGTQHLLCINADTGETNWKKDFPSAKYHIHARNSFASSSPAVDEERVYATWGTPDRISLVAFSHDGQEIWARPDLGPYASQHGYGSSPIVAGEFVIVSNQQMPSERGNETSAMLAFDRKTGEQKWSAPRTSGKASYSVPCLHHSKDGKTELLNCSTTHGIYSLDPETGAENWSFPTAFTMRTVSSLVVVGDLVFGSTGSGQGGNYLVAVNLNSHELAYKIDRQAPYVPTPVAKDDMVFLWSDKGVVACIDAISGDEYWTKRVGGNYSGSPVRAGDNIYCISEEGEVVVLAASKEYELRGKMSLGDPSRSTPAIAGGRMYLRTYSKLFSIGQ